MWWTTNELLVSEADFVPAMAWAHVRTGTAKDLLYMLRSTSNTPDNLQLEAYDITSGTPARTLLASLPGNTDIGEIRLSPNGQYMAVAVNRGMQTGFFDFTNQGSEIRVYHVGTDYQSVTLANTIQTGTNANALSFDFGPDSRYIYYVSTSQADGYQVSRVVTSTSNIENVTSLGNPASIARAGNNKLYVSAAGAAALTEIDHTPAGAASLRNVPVNADGYQLSGILPLQPHTIAPEGGVQMIFSRKLDAKSYELKDHLGNVRAVVSDRKLSDLSGSAVPYTLTNFHPGILASSNYYPFGMEMPGRNYNAPDYRYGFNGKEKDDEVTGSSGVTYDYGFRIYDSRSARFLSVDPLFKSFPWNSTYAFAENDVIRSVDLDGGEKKVVIQETGINGKPITIKDYDIVKITGANGPLGGGTLYIKSLQNKNITSVRYANYGNDGKEGQTASFQYRAYTEDLPQLYDYDIELPAKLTWESDIEVGKKSSDKIRVMGYGFGYEAGIAASFMKSTISTDGSERQWYNETKAEVSTSAGLFNFSASLNEKADFNFSGSFSVYNTNVTANPFTKKFEGASDFTIFEISEVKGIGANLSLKYNPSKDLLFQKNNSLLKQFTPDKLWDTKKYPSLLLNE